MSYQEPTTDDIRHTYLCMFIPAAQVERGQAFDRWLAEHDRQVAERAWDEGHKTWWRRGPDECHCAAWSSSECGCGKYGTGELLSLNDNPYRKEQENNNA